MHLFVKWVGGRGHKDHGAFTIPPVACIIFRFSFLLVLLDASSKPIVVISYMGKNC